jgi:hypothetical protein
MLFFLASARRRNDSASGVAPPTPTYATRSNSIPPAPTRPRQLRRSSGGSAITVQVPDQQPRRRHHGQDGRISGHVTNAEGSPSAGDRHGDGRRCNGGRRRLCGVPNERTRTGVPRRWAETGTYGITVAASGYRNVTPGGDDRERQRRPVDRRASTCWTVRGRVLDSNAIAGAMVTAAVGAPRPRPAVAASSASTERSSSPPPPTVDRRDRRRRRVATARATGVQHKTANLVLRSVRTRSRQRATLERFRRERLLPRSPTTP